MQQVKVLALVHVAKVYFEIMKKTCFILLVGTLISGCTESQKTLPEMDNQVVSAQVEESLSDHFMYRENQTDQLTDALSDEALEDPLFIIEAENLIDAPTGIYEEDIPTSNDAVAPHYEDDQFIPVEF